MRNQMHQHLFNQILDARQVATAVVNAARIFRPPVDPDHNERARTLVPAAAGPVRSPLVTVVAVLDREVESGNAGRTDECDHFPNHRGIVFRVVLDAHGRSFHGVASPQLSATASAPTSSRVGTSGEIFP
jgi:hypothetical protein